MAHGGLAGAIHGDRVRALLLSRGAYDYRPEVVVEEILERPQPVFTGNVVRSGRAWLVRPDNPLLPEQLRLKLGPARGVSGMKILFRVETGAGRDPVPQAVFLESIGEGEDARLDRLVLAQEFGLPVRFSDQAEREADQRASLEADPEDAARHDYREQFVLTIDPADAKDFDDAVALIPAGDGGSDLYVHIADVSFYVPEDTALDAEARARGTSVYFPGSVIPMLPEAVSTAAASLSPDADKRVMTVRMRFDREGRRLEREITRGWIRSKARLHYGQAQEILAGSLSAPEDLTAALRSMAGLASLLRRRRFRHGGFDLEVPEVEMRLGPDGVPRELHLRRTLETNRLIEEFMIAANLAVGDWAMERDAPFLYRVHDEPDLRALEEFQGIALSLLPGTPPSVLSDLPALRRWLSALPPTPLSRIVQRFFLRSMKKAVYSGADLGHFGLGVRAYCHFTSPIRRYPDLFNHRRIKELLDSGAGDSWMGAVDSLARDTSRTEVRAMEAEREMIRLKSVRYMERRLGQELEGRITGITSRGIFVELEDVPVDGFVPRENLPPGFRYHQEAYSWVVPHSGWSLRPGDLVLIQVLRCDLRARRIEFALLSRGGAGSRGTPSRRGKSQGGKRKVGPSRGGRADARSRGGSEARSGPRRKPSGRSGRQGSPAGGPRGTGSGRGQGPAGGPRGAGKGPGGGRSGRPRRGR